MTILKFLHAHQNIKTIILSAVMWKSQISVQNPERIPIVIENPAFPHRSQNTHHKTRASWTWTFHLNRRLK